MKKQLRDRSIEDNLVAGSPSKVIEGGSEKTEEEEQQQRKVATGNTGNNGGNGVNILNDIISSLTSPRSDSSTSPRPANFDFFEAVETDVVDESSQVNSTEQGGSARTTDSGSESSERGIISNIVANLPKSISDNAGVPESDEASILIHSIIHD